MNTISKVLRNLKIFDEPGFYIVIAVAFFSGIGIAPGLSDRNLSLLIGLFVALTAFIGVIYSKEKEWILKNREIKLQKVEDFSVNLFQWLELMDSLLSMTYILKKQELNREGVALSFYPIDVFSEEYQKGRESMTKILTHKGKHLALIALHGDAILNQETEGLLKDILNNQEKGMSGVYLLLEATGKFDIERYQSLANGHFGKIREDAKVLMTKIEVL